VGATGAVVAFVAFVVGAIFGAVIVFAVVRRSLTGKMAAVAADALSTAQRQHLELSAEVLARQRSELSDAAAKELDSRHEAIESVQAQIARTLGDLERARSEEAGQLHRQLTELSQATSTLARTLHAAPTRGAWGEFTLRRLVELSGMEPWCDFTEQGGVATADGSVRPDLVVHLPGGREVVVDAKAPLSAYLAIAEAPDPSARRHRREEAARALRLRIEELASKSYWSLLPDTLDFVVLFVPIDGVLASALEAEPTLIDHAARQRVLLATPVTLIALLKAIGYGWRQQDLARHAEEILHEARELCDRLVPMTAAAARLGRHLRQSVEEFNGFAGSLEARVLPAARRIGALGVPTRDLPAVDSVGVAPRVIGEPSPVPPYQPS
jgi:DNA recombination protein RmuC